MENNCNGNSKISIGDNFGPNDDFNPLCHIMAPQPKTSKKKIPLNESSFNQHLFEMEISNKTYIFRALKLLNSVFIHISNSDNDVINELSIAMPSNNNQIHSTTAIGVMSFCETRELATKLTKKLSKPVYLSCNITPNEVERLALEKRLLQEIKDHPEHF